MSDKTWTQFIVGQFGAVTGILAILGLFILSIAWVVWAFKTLEHIFRT